MGYSRRVHHRRRCASARSKERAMVPHIPIARRIDRTGACCHPLRCSSSSEPSPSIVPPPLNPRAIAPRCPLNRLRTRSRHLTQPIARLVCPLPRNDPANLSSTPKGCTETRVAWEADHKAVFGSSMYIRCVQWCPLTCDITDGLCTQSTRWSAVSPPFVSVTLVFAPHQAPLPTVHRSLRRMAQSAGRLPEAVCDDRPGRVW